MALPIAPTPVLEGEEATEFLLKLMKEENRKRPLIPTPNLDAVREAILADAKRRKE